MGIMTLNFFFLLGGGEGGGGGGAQGILLFFFFLDSENLSFFQVFAKRTERERRMCNFIIPLCFENERSNTFSHEDCMAFMVLECLKNDDVPHYVFQNRLLVRLGNRVLTECKRFSVKYNYALELAIISIVLLACCQDEYTLKHSLEFYIDVDDSIEILPYSLDAFLTREFRKAEMWLHSKKRKRSSLG